jgi:hypothetical protein
VGKTSVHVEDKLEPQSISIVSQSSIFARKAKEIRYSMAPVSSEISLRVNINR